MLLEENKVSTFLKKFLREADVAGLNIQPYDVSLLR